MTAKSDLRTLDWQRWAPWLIILAGLLAYSNSFQAVFVLDDIRWIVEYPPIRHLTPARDYLLGNSRPLVNLTLALNYAFGGLTVWGYHLYNLTIHLLAGLTLYGVVRRTLLLERFQGKFTDSAAGIALTTALLWVVHPLQTESVTYVIQRAESMMGLFYLLTLYGAIRGGRWIIVAVVACLAGMLTKPIMVTAPLMVVIYDWIFLRRFRWKFYGALAVTLVALVWALHSGANDWERSAGFGFKRITPLEYAGSQPLVILHYLRLFVWPYPLCLDYRWEKQISVAAIVVIVGLLAGTVWLLWRKPALGFVGLWFWLTLAPTSSFIPIGDLAFEHRMYLSLASLTLGMALAGWYLLKRGRAATVAGLTVALCVWTTLRNADYSSAMSMWQDTVARAPRNARAHQNLGKAYEEEGKWKEALQEYVTAVGLDKYDARTHYNLATALARLGKLEGAIDQFNQAVLLSPDYAEAHYNLSLALMQQGNTNAARSHLEAARRLSPGLAPISEKINNP